jgi:hypothetical protein
MPVTREGVITTSVVAGTLTCKPAFGVKWTWAAIGALNVPSTPLMVQASLSTAAVKLPLLVAAAKIGSMAADNPRSRAIPSVPDFIMARFIIVSYWRGQLRHVMTIVIAQVLAVDYCHSVVHDNVITK